MRPRDIEVCEISTIGLVLIDVAVEYVVATCDDRRLKNRRWDDGGLGPRAGVTNFR